MSLFNVDKNSDNRGSPAPNAVDVHNNPKAHATDSLSPRAEGTSGGRVVTKNDTITVYDASNQRIIIGRLPDGTYGIAVSKAGINVSDAFS